MLHRNPLLDENMGGKKFITVGEIMLRLTPPNYEKIRMALLLRPAMGAAKRISPWPWQTWG